MRPHALLQRQAPGMALLQLALSCHTVVALQLAHSRGPARLLPAQHAHSSPLPARDVNTATGASTASTGSELEVIRDRLSGTVTQTSLDGLN